MSSFLHMADRRQPPPIVYILALLSILAGGWLLSRQGSNPTSSPLAGSTPPSNVSAPPQNVTTSTPQQPDPSVGTLRILGDTFSGYSTFRDPSFQQTLADAAITLSYADEFDQAQRAAALGSDTADLIVTTLDQFLKQDPAGKVVALIDRTVGADAVVLNSVKYPGLNSLLVLDQLIEEQRNQGNQLIATYAGDTPSEYLALVLDAKFNTFNLSDFRIQEQTDASEAWTLLQDRNEPVAVAVLWEPYVSQARRNGYTVVLSSEDAPTSIVDVLVASDSLINSQPDTLSTLIETYYRRIDTNVRDAAQLQAQIAQDGNLTPEDAAAVIDGIQFFTALEAEQWFKDGTFERRIQSTAAVLTLSGQLNAVPSNPTDLFTSAFIDRAARNNETLIDLIRADNPELAERLSGQRTAITPSLTPAQIQAAPDIGTLAIQGEVKFATGSAQLTGASQSTLNQLAREIAEFSPETVAVRVIGHTSRTGAADLNQRLSQQRAQVVVDYLENQGGLPNNIAAEGQGFNEPLPNTDPAAAVNQRTEIRLVRVN